jgi:hypothetical protein
MFVSFRIKSRVQNRQHTSEARPRKPDKAFSFGARRLASNGAARLFVPNMHQFSPASGDLEKPNTVLRSLHTAI